MGFTKKPSKNINFHYRTNSEKINDQIFQILKTLFKTNSPIVRVKQFFLS